MERVVNSGQMRESDTYTHKTMGMPLAVLMERAALSVVEVLFDEELPVRRILCLCGMGNNGGDGIAAARILHKKGYAVDIHLVGDPAKMTEQTREQKQIAENFNTPFVQDPVFSEYTTIIDALFGVGLSRPLTDSYIGLIRDINHAQAKVLSVDIPSGIQATTGAVMGVAVYADVTVTFAFSKVGLLLYPGAKHAGKVVLTDVGIVESQTAPFRPDIHRITRDDLALIPPREPVSNKGTYGKVLLVAGSSGMSGACYLSALAAFRMGVGMVRIHTYHENREVLQRLLPEAIISVYYNDDPQTDALREGIRWADVVGIGPGIGTGKDAVKLTEEVLTKTDKPLVIDADALNILSAHREWLSVCTYPAILTPHPGEMSRLTDKTAAQLLEDMIGAASAFADEYRVTCVLKDARTVTANTCGQVFINTTGNNGMATAGSGDVLTGVILGLCARGTDPDYAGALGAYVHGLAGDLACEKQGPSYMMASDIVEALKKLDI